MLLHRATTVLLRRARTTRAASLSPAPAPPPPVPPPPWLVNASRTLREDLSAVAPPRGGVAEWVERLLTLPAPPASGAGGGGGAQQLEARLRKRARAAAVISAAAAAAAPARSFAAILRALARADVVDAGTLDAAWAAARAAAARGGVGEPPPSLSSSAEAGVPGDNGRGDGAPSASAAGRGDGAPAADADGAPDAGAPDAAGAASASAAVLDAYAVCLLAAGRPVDAANALVKEAGGLPSPPRPIAAAVLDALVTLLENSSRPGDAAAAAAAGGAARPALPITSSRALGVLARLLCGPPAPAPAALAGALTAERSDAALNALSLGARWDDATALACKLVRIEAAGRAERLGQRPAAAEGARPASIVSPWSILRLMTLLGVAGRHKELETVLAVLDAVPPETDESSRPPADGGGAAHVASWRLRPGATALSIVLRSAALAGDVDRTRALLTRMRAEQLMPTPKAALAVAELRRARVARGRGALEPGGGGASSAAGGDAAAAAAGGDAAAAGGDAAAGSDAAAGDDAAAGRDAARERDAARARSLSALNDLVERSLMDTIEGVRHRAYHAAGGQRAVAGAGDLLRLLPSVNAAARSYFALGRPFEALRLVSLAADGQPAALARGDTFRTLALGLALAGGERAAGWRADAVEAAWGGDAATAAARRPRGGGYAEPFTLVMGGGAPSGPPRRAGALRPGEKRMEHECVDLRAVWRLLAALRAAEVAAFAADATPRGGLPSAAAVMRALVAGGHGELLPTFASAPNLLDAIAHFRIRAPGDGPDRVVFDGGGDAGGGAGGARGDGRGRRPRHRHALSRALDDAHELEDDPLPLVRAVAAAAVASARGIAATATGAGGAAAAAAAAADAQREVAVAAASVVRTAFDRVPVARALQLFLELYAGGAFQARLTSSDVAAVLPSALVVDVRAVGRPDVAALFVAVTLAAAARARALRTHWAADGGVGQPLSPRLAGATLVPPASASARQQPRGAALPPPSSPSSRPSPPPTVFFVTGNSINVSAERVSRALLAEMDARPLAPRPPGAARRRDEQPSPAVPGALRAERGIVLPTAAIGAWLDVDAAETAAAAAAMAERVRAEVEKSAREGGAAGELDAADADLSAEGVTAEEA